MGVSGTLNMAGTPEHAEAERAFAIIGEKADKIDAAKLAEFLRALGQTPTQAQVNALPAESDFAAAWSHYEANKKEPIALSAIEDVFKVFDDGTGKIAFKDLERCLTIFGGVSGDNLSPEEITDLKALAHIDENAGGMWDYRAFVDLMNETQQVHVTSSVDDDSWPGILRTCSPALPL